MYHEITPLYYSHVHYSLFCNIEILCLRQQDILEVLSRTLGAQFIGFIGVHNTQYIQHLTLSCGDFGQYDEDDEHYNQTQVSQTLTLSLWLVMAFVHLLATNVQSSFPNRPTVHCNTKVASVVFELIVHPDRRLTGTIWHHSQGWKAELQSSMFQTLERLHALFTSDFELLSYAFDKFFWTFRAQERDVEGTRISEEECSRFLKNKTQQMLEGYEVILMNALHP